MKTIDHQLSSKNPIGFPLPGPFPRMEEEDDTQELSRTGFGESQSPLTKEEKEMLFDGLMRERIYLLEAKDIENREKLKLLEGNRQLFIAVLGGSPYKFGSEKVIYAILIFSATVLVVLSLLTAFYQLPQEVTITFVGTVLGGTIATIAQKLGKVGR